MSNPLDGPLVLLPQIEDRIGRVIYNVHAFDGAARTVATISQTPILGQVRFEPGNDDSAFLPEWPDVEDDEEDEGPDWNPGDDN